MRPIILAASLALWAAPAAANDEFCQTQFAVAAKVMEARQNGVPLSRMMAVNAELGGPDRQLYDEMTLRAYDAPLFETEKRKSSIITEFGNEFMAACYRGLAQITQR